MHLPTWMRRLLFPPMWIVILLLPLATCALTYSMLMLPETDVRRIGSYVLAAYTLTLWCVRIPAIWRFGKRVRRENRYYRRWSEDVRLRTQITLLGNVLWNSGYAALQLGLGIVHHAAWFYALAGYYGCLALMRFFLVRHTLSHAPGENLRREWIHYRTCGWVFLVLNLALSAMIFYMLAENRMVEHHEITTIAMAAYTFTTLTMAIVQMVRYRKLGSPVLSAAKAISLTAVSVSMLTLEATMLVTFSGEGMTRRMIGLFMSLSGGAVSVGIVTMAVYMIVKANRNRRRIEEENEG